jgi:ADP-ribosylarginine hydrolase
LSFFSGAIGDAIGYKNGSWEFCRDGRFIHNELESLGGLENLCIDKTNWRVSDDTVMHIATAEALVDWKDTVKKLRFCQITFLILLLLLELTTTSENDTFCECRINKIFTSNFVNVMLRIGMTWMDVLLEFKLAKRFLISKEV